LTGDQEEGQEAGADGELIAKKGEIEFKIDEDEDCGEVQVVSTA